MKNKEIEGWKEKETCVNVHTIEYYAAVQKMDADLLSWALKNPQDILLSKIIIIIQVQNNTYSLELHV